MTELKFPALAFLISTFSFFQVHGQDNIVKKNGNIMKAKIQSVDLDNVFYKAYDNLEGPDLVIRKSDLNEIKFENGKSEHFGQPASGNESSLEETKQFLIEEVGKHCYDPDSFKRRFVASFEGDYIRLTLLRKR